ncbi:hypothetical protein ACFSCW_12965 [Sphingomonas tabacisoli]|uniref:Uncharacterized protein n=1 Tax=Sphingomonas tabacisoli TaxID=2249466 RepID=A0ABW4I456_9SPHN
MFSSEKTTLARVSAQSSANVIAAQLSCKEAAEHVRQSEAAIERSRALLAGTRQSMPDQGA